MQSSTNYWDCNMATENKTEKKKTVREVLQDLFAKLNASQVKLLQNWCMDKYSMQLTNWIAREMPNKEPTMLLKQFVVEVEKAFKTGNWTYFEPAKNNPSDGQAVTTEAQVGDEPEATTETTETEEEEDEDTEDADDDTDAPIPAQDGRGVPASRIPEPEEEDDPAPVAAKPVPVAPAKAKADPFDGLVEAIADRVLAKMGGAVPNLNDAIDKRLSNGGFPAKQVEEMLNARTVQMIASYLLAQEPELVEQAIEIWEKEGK